MLGIFGGRTRWVVVAAACLAPWHAHAALAQSAGNVAVVINDNSPDSQRIGEYYARTRALPADHVFHIRASAEETVERAAYASTIELPIAAAIRRAGLQDRILYLVLTKGIPLKIDGTAGLDGTLSSVDSELTLLYRRMTGQPVPAAGKIDNPYFLGARDLREARPFSHREHDIYLVTRIDAFTVDEALSLVDRAQAPQGDGLIVLDQRDEDATRGAGQWIAQAAQRLNDQGHAARTILESTAKPARADGPVIGFYSWGVSDPERRRRSTGMTFTAGAIAAALASSNARTFKEPPGNWTPAESADPSTFFAGSAETLIGDVIREGVTGVSGQVAEPYLLGAVHPEILFPAYLAGFSLADAFYLATPSLSWTTMFVGDPLCRPFAGRTLTSAELETAVDARTGLPGIFSERRLSQAFAATPGIPQAVVTLTVRAETMLERGDNKAARAALEEAVKAAPAAFGLLLRLATLEEAEGLHDAAIARYQRIVEGQPANVIALNNLAYALAVRRNAPADALPLAKRAAVLAPRSSSVLDTLAWIEHLLGNHAAAATILSEAIKLDPAAAEVRWHAAAVAAAQGDRIKAESELKEALRLDSSLEAREETKQLRERIAALPLQRLI